MPLRHLRDHALAGRQLLHASAQIAAELPLPDGLDCKAESHFRLFEHIPRVGLGEGVAWTVTAAQRGDLFLKGPDRGGDHIVKK